jgi:Ankyrin repeats (3 copies)
VQRQRISPIAERYRTGDGFQRPFPSGQYPLPVLPFSPSQGVTTGTHIEMTLAARPNTMANAMDVKTAIRNGDAEALRRLLDEDTARADALVRWGANDCVLTHPLHYVSDMRFEGTLTKGRELPLIEALISAGADLDFQRDGKKGKSDTPLIGAASLGAEEVGLRLLDAGARPELRGLLGETALHWAALLGEDRLAARLIEGSDLNLRDQEYDSPPLGWAIHGCYDPPAGNHGRQREVVTLLVSAGAKVEAHWLESERVRADPSMLAALRAITR